VCLGKRFVSLFNLKETINWKIKFQKRRIRRDTYGLRVVFSNVKQKFQNQIGLIGHFLRPSQLHLFESPHCHHFMGKILSVPVAGRLTN
jgi:hypothetical protein